MISNKYILLVAIVFLFSASYSAQTKLIPFLKGNKWGYSDLQGKLIVPAEYDSVDYFPTGFDAFIVRKNGKEGLMDSLGKLICPPKYDAIENVFGGVFHLIENQKIIFTKNPFESKHTHSYDRIDFLYADYHQLSSPYVYLKNGKMGLLEINYEKGLLAETQALYDSISLEVINDSIPKLLGWNGKKSQKIVLPKNIVPLLTQSGDEIEIQDVLETLIFPIKTQIEDSCGLKCVSVYERMDRKSGEKEQWKKTFSSPWCDRIEPALRIKYDNPLSEIYYMEHGNKWGLYSLRSRKFVIPLSYDSLIFQKACYRLIRETGKPEVCNFYHAIVGDSIELLSTPIYGEFVKILTYHKNQLIEHLGRWDNCIVCVHEGKKAKVYISPEDRMLVLNPAPEKIERIMEYTKTYQIALVEHQGKKFYLDLISGRWYYEP